MIYQMDGWRALGGKSPSPSSSPSPYSSPSSSPSCVRLIGRRTHGEKTQACSRFCSETPKTGVRVRHTVLDLSGKSCCRTETQKIILKKYLNETHNFPPAEDASLVLPPTIVLRDSGSSLSFLSVRI